MSIRLDGFGKFARDLETLPERAGDEFPRVLSRGGVQIKKDWRARWTAIRHPSGTHIPYLVYGIGYDAQSMPPRWSVSVGIAATNSQSPLGHLIEFGSLRSAPHPAGQQSLDVETPRFVAAVGHLAENLLAP